MLTPPQHCNDDDGGDLTAAAPMATTTTTKSSSTDTTPLWTPQEMVDDARRRSEMAVEVRMYIILVLAKVCLFLDQSFF